MRRKFLSITLGYTVDSKRLFLKISESIYYTYYAPHSFFTLPATQKYFCVPVPCLLVPSPVYTVRYNPVLALWIGKKWRKVQK